MESTGHFKERESVDEHRKYSIGSQGQMIQITEALGMETILEKDDMSSESDAEEAEEITDLSVRRRTQNSKFKDL